MLRNDFYLNPPRTDVVLLDDISAGSLADTHRGVLPAGRPYEPQARACRSGWWKPLGPTQVDLWDADRGRVDVRKTLFGMRILGCGSDLRMGPVSVGQCGLGGTIAVDVDVNVDEVDALWSA